MLTIRQEQFESFRQIGIRDFEERMMEHMRKFFPTQVETLGEGGITRLIQHGIKRAESYGIIAERDVCKYIDLSVVFGRDFDTDPKLAWARTILGDSTLSPIERMNRLYDVAMQNMRR